VNSAQDTPLVLCADVGKTSCRVALISAGAVLETAEQEGAPAFGDLAVASATAIYGAIERMPRDLVSAASAVSVGGAGLLTDTGQRESLAHSLHDTLGLPVAVTSDIVTAHLGAFAGSDGVALVAGTGAVALGVDAAGDIRLIDGWGPDFGDLGSGAWIGREGFAAALSAACGRGPETSLTDAVARLTEGAEPTGWVRSTGNHARQLARLAPAVLDAAASGDTVAGDVVRNAVSLLLATASAAGGPAIAVLGGLGAHPWFRTQLENALSGAGLVVTAPAGDALHGAYLAATRTDLPHERHIHRA